MNIFKMIRSYNTTVNVVENPSNWRVFDKKISKFLCIFYDVRNRSHPISPRKHARIEKLYYIKYMLAISHDQARI